MRGFAASVEYNNGDKEFSIGFMGTNVRFVE